MPWKGVLLYPDLTVSDFLSFVGVVKKTSARQFDTAIAQCGLEGWLRRYHVLPGAEIVPDGPARLYLRDRQTIPVVEVALATRAPERFTAVLYGARRIDVVATDNKMNGRVFLGARSSVQGVIPVGVVVETTGEQDGRLGVYGTARCSATCSCGRVRRIERIALCLATRGNRRYQTWWMDRDVWSYGGTVKPRSGPQS